MWRVSHAAYWELLLFFLVLANRQAAQSLAGRGQSGLPLHASWPTRVHDPDAPPLPHPPPPPSFGLFDGNEQ